MTRFAISVLLLALSGFASADILSPVSDRITTVGTTISQDVTVTTWVLYITQEGDYSVQGINFPYRSPSYRPPRYFGLDVLAVDVVDFSGNVLAHSDGSYATDAPPAIGHFQPGYYQIRIRTWLTGWNGSWGWYGKLIAKAAGPL